MDTDKRSYIDRVVTGFSHVPGVVSIIGVEGEARLSYTVSVRDCPPKTVIDLVNMAARLEKAALPTAVCIGVRLMPLDLTAPYIPQINRMFRVLYTADSPARRS